MPTRGGGLFARLSALLVGSARLLSSSHAAAQVTIQVDPAADQRPISPLIYGANFASSEQIAEGGLTLTRWGGNRTTRYNYLIDVDNTAFDYYFENLPGCWSAAGNWCSSPPSDAKEQSGANAFLSGAVSSNVVALFTVPTMGWVANAAQYGHPFDCSCTQAGQDAYDPYESSCGNGQSGGMWVDCGAQTDTSIAIDPAWVKDWVTYLVGKFGPSNGRRIYALDNEPALWFSTHHDMRKTRLGYDELWQKMRDYAVAILEADPTAEIAGPAEWGYPNFFCSDLDDISQGCSENSPDRGAHGGTELVAWLLDQANAYEQQNGKRILHYLDLHYYPQGGTNPTRTRSLWDATYVDPSWINDTIRLVPRMRDWVSGHYPGTKLALSEFDFYDHDQGVGAVTYAEILGILGREGMDLATTWSPPATTEAAFAAYRLFRNYDGAGGAFESTSVRVTVTGSNVAAFAATSPTRMTVAIANEGTATSATIDVGAFEAGSSAQIYRHAGTGSDVSADADIVVNNGSATVDLPGTSITMVVFSGTNPVAPEAGAGGNGSGGADSGGVTSSGGAGAAGVTSSGGSAGAAGPDASLGGNGGSAGASGSSGMPSGDSSASGAGGATIDADAASNGDQKSGDNGGCGCHTSKTSRTIAITPLLALIGAVVLRRRRSRANRATSC